MDKDAKMWWRPADQLIVLRRSGDAEVAEDQPANRELMERLLGEVGFELRFAEDGRAAVEAVDEWRPDFVWMDLKMPEMDGDEATQDVDASTPGEAPVAGHHVLAIPSAGDAAPAEEVAGTRRRPRCPGPPWWRAWGGALRQPHSGRPPWPAGRKSQIEFFK